MLEPEVFCVSTNQRDNKLPLGIATMQSNHVVAFLLIFEVRAMASFMTSDDENEEEEFPGFTAEDIAELQSVESDDESSGESDISFNEETSDSESESSDSEEEEESVWSRDLGEIDMAAFEYTPRRG